MMGLGWLPPSAGGWINLDSDIIHRRPFPHEAVCLGMSLEVLMSVCAHHHAMLEETLAQAALKKSANRKRTG